MTTQSLVWLIPLPPLVAFALIILWTNKWKAVSHTLAIAGAALSWFMSMVVFFAAIRVPNLAEDPIASAFEWLPIGAHALRIGIQIDSLSAVVLFFVSWTILMIFIYSVGYHNFGQPKGENDLAGLPPHGAGIKDEHGHIHLVPSIEPMYSRFFAFISLFAFAMYLLVVSDNLLTLYVGWEIMGLCSYLLIGFWFAKESARKAAIKAFITTRVGDVFMLLGIAFLYYATGTLNYKEIFGNPELLARMASTPSTILGLSVAGLIGLLLFIGTVGKSAQFPLHVWLPDAMEGPTPVSAMIHAATMVSAGVYMCDPHLPPALRRLGARYAAHPGIDDCGDHWRLHGVVRGDHRCGSERHQTRSGLFDHLAIGVYDRSAGYWCVCGSHIPPGHSCVFQGIALPRLRFRDPRDGAWCLAHRRAGRSTGYVEYGRIAQEDARHILDLLDRWICPVRFSAPHSRILVER